MKTAEFTVTLTDAQRRVIADLFPQKVHRLELQARGMRRITFKVYELQAILWSAGEARAVTDSGTERRTLDCLIGLFKTAVEDAHSIEGIPPGKRLYQFKVTLREIEPPVWRRIQVKDCSMDKLHEHIQTAMGWTNSHLHRFEILGIVHGDPELLCGNPEAFVGSDSLRTKVSEIVPKSGVQFRFSYEYDFGDRWRHDVLFEGCLASDEGVRYPICVEGERACPPEDVGGVSGYRRFLEIMADPSHEEYGEWVQWAGGEFDPEHFDAQEATDRMQHGLPDWRRLEPVY